MTPLFWEVLIGAGSEPLPEPLLDHALSHLSRPSYIQGFWRTPLERSFAEDTFLIRFYFMALFPESWGDSWDEPRTADSWEREVANKLQGWGTIHAEFVPLLGEVPEERFRPLPRGELP